MTSKRKPTWHGRMYTAIRYIATRPMPRSCEVKGLSAPSPTRLISKINHTILKQIHPHQSLLSSHLLPSPGLHLLAVTDKYSRNTCCFDCGQDLFGITRTCLLCRPVHPRSGVSDPAVCTHRAFHYHPAKLLPWLRLCYLEPSSSYLDPSFPSETAILYWKSPRFSANR